MTITNGYSTVAQFQVKAGDASSSTSNQTFIENCIERASRIIDTKTNSFFYTKTLTNEYIDVYGFSDNGLKIQENGTVIYAFAPIISVSALAEDGSSLVANTDFYIHKKEGKIDRDGSWTTTRRGIVLSGSIGWSSAPEDITECCLTIAGALSGLIKRSWTTEDGSIQSVVMRDVPKWVNEILERYKFYNV